MKLARKIFAEGRRAAGRHLVGSGGKRVETESSFVGGSFGLVAVHSQHRPQYGLRQNAYIDERNSFEQATRASARYLKDLAARYNGNWELAMAAYNTGAGNIDRAISRAGSQLLDDLSVHRAGNSQLRSKHSGGDPDCQES